VLSTAAVKETFHGRIAKKGVSTLASKPLTTLYPIHLWQALTEEDRRRTLTTLSQIVAKRLQPPPDAKEVEHEDH
jgi:hypothetical protein